MAAQLSLEQRLRRLEDIEEIKQLKARYCAFNDGGWQAKGASHMGDTASLFLEDGVWDGRPAAPRAEGREAIRQMIVSYRALPFVMHLVTNPIITVSDNEATGSWDVILPGANAQGRPELAVGTYEDEYARTADGWKFRSLRFILTGLAPQHSGWEPQAAMFD